MSLPPVYPGHKMRKAQLKELNDQYTHYLLVTRKLNKLKPNQSEMDLLKAWTNLYTIRAEGFVSSQYLYRHSVNEEVLTLVCDAIQTV